MPTTNTTKQTPCSSSPVHPVELPISRDYSTGAPCSEAWTQVIEPKGRWFDLKLKELWRFRDLILLFFRRDFVAQYKQTILGPVWYLIQPLMTTGIFTVIFGNVAKLPTDGLPKFLFYMSGIVVWRYFADCLTQISATFTGNAHLFGKVYFPRLAVPLSKLLTNLLTFGLQFILFLCFMAYFGIKGAAIKPNIWLATFPLLLLMMAGMGLGFGIILSSATSKYRDLQQLVGFGTQLLMYATPIIYPLSVIPEKYRWILIANPMTSIIETFRFGFLGAGTINPSHLAYSGIFTVVVLLFGILIFNRVERTFMDTV